MRAPPLVCSVLSAAAVACGGGDGGTGGGPVAPPVTPPATTPPAGSAGPPPPSTSSAVTVQNNAFAPGEVSVAAGTTVTWTWDTCSGDGYGGSTCGIHNVTFDAGGPGSGTRSEGTFSRQFAAPGTYTYHCTIHGAGMSGRVVVR